MYGVSVSLSVRTSEIRTAAKHLSSLLFDLNLHLTFLPYRLYSHHIVPTSLTLTHSYFIHCLSLSLPSHLIPLPLSFAHSLLSSITIFPLISTHSFLTNPHKHRTSSHTPLPYRSHLSLPIILIIPRCDGSWGLAVVHKDKPDEIVVACNGSPMVRTDCRMCMHDNIKSAVRMHLHCLLVRMYVSDYMTVFTVSLILTLLLSLHTCSLLHEH